MSALTRWKSLKKMEEVQIRLSTLFGRASVGCYRWCHTVTRRRVKVSRGLRACVPSNCLHGLKKISKRQALAPSGGGSEGCWQGSCRNTSRKDEHEFGITKLPEESYETALLHNCAGLALPGVVDRIRPGASVLLVCREPVGRRGIRGSARFHTISGNAAVDGHGVFVGLAIAGEGSACLARAGIARRARLLTAAGVAEGNGALGKVRRAERRAGERRTFKSRASAQTRQTQRRLREIEVCTRATCERRRVAFSPLATRTGETVL